MCGRYTILFAWKQIWKLSVPFWQTLPAPEPRYNVAPKSDVPIVRVNEGRAEIAEARWWLIPRWSRTPDSRLTTFNARSETVHTSKTFKPSLRDRRCIVPASGFYEWKAHADGSKTPHYITRADGEPLCFAGLWDRWGDPSMEQIDTCTLLTTAPNAEMRHLHDRMPCLLETEDHDAWLDHERPADDVLGLLRPAADGVLIHHPVSRRVGSVRNDDPRLIDPVDPPKDGPPESLFG